MSAAQGNLSPVKRHNFPPVQPFDEGGRRIATPSALTSTIGMRLFSNLDDGTGFTPVEYLLDAWIDEGIENSTEILQVLVPLTMTVTISVSYYQYFEFVHLNNLYVLKQTNLIRSSIAGIIHSKWLCLWCDEVDPALHIEVIWCLNIYAYLSKFFLC